MIWTNLFRCYAISKLQKAFPGFSERDKRYKMVLISSWAQLLRHKKIALETKKKKDFPIHPSICITMFSKECINLSSKYVVLENDPFCFLYRNYFEAFPSVLA